MLVLDYLAAQPSYDFLFGDQATARDALDRLIFEDRLEYAIESCIGMHDGQECLALAALHSFEERRRQAPVHIRALLREGSRHGIPTDVLQSRLRLLQRAIAPIGPRDLYLSRLAVTPGMQRAGLGRLALDEVLRRFHRSGAERLVLDTATTNDSARAFYRNAGFVERIADIDAAADAPTFISLHLERSALPEIIGGTRVT